MYSSITCKSNTHLSIMIILIFLSLSFHTIGSTVITCYEASTFAWNHNLTIDCSFWRKVQVFVADLLYSLPAYSNSNTKNLFLFTAYFWIRNNAPNAHLVRKFHQSSYYIQDIQYTYTVCLCTCLLDTVQCIADNTHTFRLYFKLQNILLRRK